MATTEGGDAEFSTRFEGYADYEIVSLRVGRAIDQAVDSYARIDAAHTEGATVSPELAAEARGRILGAAMKLLPPLQADREAVDLYADILDRWKGENGFIARMDTVSLRRECPGWLFKFVLDIRRAGWEIGFLQAGRTKKEYDDPTEGETEAMFKGLQ
jgi:hypothetical protein